MIRLWYGALSVLTLAPWPFLSLRTKHFRILFASWFWLELLVKSKMWKMEVKRKPCFWETVVLKNGRFADHFMSLASWSWWCWFLRLPFKLQLLHTAVLHLVSLVTVPDFLVPSFQDFSPQLPLQSCKS